MGLGDVWYKTKVYFGLAEDDDLYEDDEDGTQAEEDLEQRYRRRPNVRPLDARRGRGEVRVDDIFSDEEASTSSRRRLRDAGAQTTVLRPAESVGADDVPKVYLSVPRTF
ncbi:MAG: cell division inhibitor SepF, partial [Gaiellales bacterium]|nr:cell division inhibitor SepF [Gaiellales bacterium]